APEPPPPGWHRAEEARDVGLQSRAALGLCAHGASHALPTPATEHVPCPVPAVGHDRRGPVPGPGACSGSYPPRPCPRGAPAAPPPRAGGPPSPGLRPHPPPPALLHRPPR